jgi:hypothetical protein
MLLSKVEHHQAELPVPALALAPIPSASRKSRRAKLLRVVKNTISGAGKKNRVENLKRNAARTTNLACLRNTMVGFTKYAKVQINGAGKRNLEAL